MICPNCKSENIKRTNDREYNITHRKVNIICLDCGHEWVHKYPAGEKIQQEQADILNNAKSMINGEYKKVVINGYAICEHCGKGYLPEDYGVHFQLCDPLDVLIKQKITLETQIESLKKEIERYDKSIEEKYTPVTDDGSAITSDVGETANTNVKIDFNNSDVDIDLYKDLDSNGTMD